MRRTGLIPLFLLCAVTVLFQAVPAQTDEEKIQNAPWFEQPIAGGVTYRSYRFDDLFESRQVIYVTQVDLNHPDVGIHFGYRPNGATATFFEFQLDFSSSVAAVNGNFFDGRGSLQYLKANGVVVNQTRNGAVLDEGALAMTSEGEAQILTRPDGGWGTASHPHIMATDATLVIKGVPSPLPATADYQKVRDARTAVGITAENQMLVVLVDAGWRNAHGMTYPELARLMSALGALDAINLGGSRGSGILAQGVHEQKGNEGIAGYPFRRPNALVVTSSAPPIPPGPYENPGRGHLPMQVNLLSGASKSLQLGVSNDGTSAWIGPESFIQTTELVGHSSPFYTPGVWIDPMRPRDLGPFSLNPPAGTTYEFIVTAPEVTELTYIEDSFGIGNTDVGSFGFQQSRVYASVVPPSWLNTIVVESRLPDGTRSPAPSYEESGRFFNTTSKSNLYLPPAMGNGARYSTTIGDSATFRPTLPASGVYNVYVTMGWGNNNNAHASFVLGNAAADITGTVHFGPPEGPPYNRWLKVASHVPFNAGERAFITFTNLDGDDDTGERFVMDAVYFEQVQVAPPDGKTWVVR